MNALKKLIEYGLFVPLNILALLIGFLCSIAELGWSLGWSLGNQLYNWITDEPLRFRKWIRLRK